MDEVAALVAVAPLEDSKKLGTRKRSFFCGAGDKKCFALISVCIEDSEGIIFTDGKGRIVARAVAVRENELCYTCLE